jgi:S1-C subfamily serine protease
VKKCAAMALVLLAGTFAGVAAVTNGVPSPGDAALVQLIVTCQEQDPYQPWEERQPSFRLGYGVLISSNRVVTTESLIRNQRLIQMRRPRSGERIPAELESADPQLNLALLRLDDTMAETVPLETAESVPQNSEVDIVQFDEASEVQHGVGRVYQITMAPLPRAPYATLNYGLLSDFNVSGEGAPVLLGGKLAGIMMSYTWGTRTGNMIPYSTIRRFIADVSKPPYQGVASAGFAWADLVDPVKRKYLRVTDRTGGVLVVQALPRTGAAVTLRPQDVILDWDGKAVDNMGFIHDSALGRIPFTYLITHVRRPGDSVPVRIVRNGTEQAVQVVLNRHNDWDQLIPENVAGEKAEYMVEGGLILRELDGLYLKMRGNDWQSSADSRLVHAYVVNRQTPPDPGDRIVILTAVLPDPVNLGYQTCREEVVIRVNGEAVHRMTDVFRIANRDRGIRRLSLKGVDTDLILDPAAVAEANTRLSKTFRISELRWQKKESVSHGR